MSYSLLIELKKAIAMKFLNFVFLITLEIDLVPFKIPYTVWSDCSVLDNPNHVVAFPCGSKSIIKIFFHNCDKADAKFITVVVLTTPPF